MAQPLYQFTDIVKKHDIQVLSGNFHLYTDMSNRVMQVLADMAPVAQQYSIGSALFKWSTLNVSA